MPRPVRRVVQESIQAWDADVDRNFEIITDSPFPICVAVSVTALTTSFPPVDYVDCIALVLGVIHVSNGTAWNPVVTSQIVSTSTATTVSQMATDFNNLVSALRVAGVLAPL